MQPALHQDLADELWEADRSAKPIAPLTERHDGLDVEDAYAIQTINIERRVADGPEGDRPQGRPDLQAHADACSA